ncbi:MAG: hypothetical protein ACRCYX_10695 [Dermatophilaceae bacterium]
MSLLRLRPSTHVAPVADGLLFVGWRNSFVLTGSTSVQRLWGAVAPHLDSGVRRDQLIAAVPSTVAPVLNRLLEALESQAMLVRPEPDVRLPDGVADSHQSVITFLESCADRPLRSFLRVHQASVEVSGHPSLVVAARQVLADLGFGAIAPHPRSESDRLRLEVADADENRYCVEAVTGDAMCVLGPAGPVGSRPTLDDGLARMAARGLELPRGDDPSAVVTRLVANLAALEVWFVTAAVTPSHRGYLRRVVTDGLRVTAHPVLLPGDLGAGRRDDIVRPEEAGPAATLQPELTGPAAPQAPDAVVDGHWALMSDPVTGILLDLGPRDLSQQPIPRATARAVRGARTWAFGATTDLARRRAGLSALKNLVPVGDQMLAICGTDRASMERDAVRAHVARCLATGRPLHSMSPTPASSEPVSALLVPDPTATSGAPDLLVHRHRVGEQFAVVVVRDGHGAARSVVFDDDDDEATFAATAQALLACDAPAGEVDPHPTLAWDEARWDPRQAMDQLGVELVCHVWAGEPAIGLVGVVGWAEVRS